MEDTKAYRSQKAVGRAIGHLTGTNTQDPKKLLLNAPYPDVPDDVLFDSEDWPLHPVTQHKLFRLDFLAEDGATSPRNTTQFGLLVDYVKMQGAALHPDAAPALSVILHVHLAPLVAEKFAYIRREQRKYLSGRKGKSKASTSAANAGNANDDDDDDRDEEDEEDEDEGVKEHITSQTQDSRAKTVSLSSVPPRLDVGCSSDENLEDTGPAGSKARIPVRRPPIPPSQVRHRIQRGVHASPRADRG